MPTIGTEWRRMGARTEGDCTATRREVLIGKKSPPLCFSGAHTPSVCMYTQSLQSCLNLCDPMDCNPPGSSVHGILQARILEWVAMPFSQGSSQPSDQTLIFCIAGRFFSAEPPGKPPHTVCESESRSVMSDSLRPHGLYSPWNSPGQNAGVVAFHFSRGSSQGIFPTQGSNPGLSHCRRILCQLNHQGSPHSIYIS